MKKKILVVYGNEEIEAKYKKAIEQLGFQHISFFRDSAPYKEFRPTLIDRAYNIFRRLFFNDKLALHRAYDRDRDRQNVKKMKEIAKKHPNIDKVLMFRADIFPKKMIKLCRKISKNMITHQFDGMKVCQKLMTFYKSFDRIFVFDKKDLEDYKRYGFMPLTNSWFPDEDYNINEIKQDLFYVGVGTPDRIEKITRLNEKIQQTQYSLNAYLSVSHAGLERQWGGVQLGVKPMKYSDNIANVKKSNAIVDMKLSHHDGLSYRFFEAIYYKKKLITDNKAVVNYDFYHPDNIYITDYENFDGIEAFLEKPYVEIDDTIVQKYSLENWLRYALDLPPYTPIDLA